MWNPHHGFSVKRSSHDPKEPSYAWFHPLTVGNLSIKGYNIIYIYIIYTMYRISTITAKNISLYHPNHVLYIYIFLIDPHPIFPWYPIPSTSSASHPRVTGSPTRQSLPSAISRPTIVGSPGRQTTCARPRAPPGWPPRTPRTHREWGTFWFHKTWSFWSYQLSIYLSILN